MYYTVAMVMSKKVFGNRPNKTKANGRMDKETCSEGLLESKKHGGMCFACMPYV